MFAEHQPLLSNLGRSNAAGLERILTFVLCTIRQPLRIACIDYKSVRKGDSRPLFGMKHAGLAYVRANAAELWERCEYLYETCDDEAAADLIVTTLCEVPGLGPAKAGFACQIIYGLSGCLDTHNLKRFNLPERTFRGREAKYSEKRFRQIIRDYNAFCRRAGGAAFLWDSWCNGLAETDPINYPTGYRVSELHLTPREC